MVSLIKIPHLDKGAVQNYVGFSSFQKGEHYALNKAIRQGKLKNQVLTALCQGREFDPYRVEVIFNSEGIQQGYCSCPVGAGGKCKHIAALLLTWLDTPESFVEWEDVKLNLQAYDASTLLELIDLLDDKVETSSEVIRAFSKHLQTAKSPRLARYARRIDDAFHISEFSWYHPDEGGLAEIAFALDKIRSDADRLLAEGQIEEAVRINQDLVQQILNHLDDHLDPWGNLSEELKRCVHSLGEALRHLDKGEDLRIKIFQRLFRLVEEQIYREVNIRAEEAKEVILQHVYPDERDKIVSWIKAIQIRPLDDEEQRHLGLEDFLIDLQKDLLEPDVYLTHYRERGQVLKLVDSLLALDRVDEAKHTAQQKEFAFQTLSLADLFTKYHQDEIAEKLVLAFSHHHPDLPALRWLKDFYQQRNKLGAALEVAKQILYLSPQFSYYQMVQDLAQKLNQWALLRQEIIDHFKGIPDELLLIEIYLDEKEIEKAIEAFDKISHLYYYSFKDTHYVLLALRLADSARARFPRFSLKIYQELVEDLIEERGRESYRQACDHLKTIRSVFEDLQQRDEWEAYLRALMQTYRRLKAFQDEINRAGLFND
jgi:uncharacterized Zn finger protein